MRRSAALFCAVGLLLVSSVEAGDIGFAEEFALAKDRTEALKKLIPGTEEYYYYHCLQYLNTAQYDKAVVLFKPWFERFKQTPRLTEIQTRHALLSYERNPQQSLDYFKNRLGLVFQHQKVIQGAVPNLPTFLDPKTFSRERLASDSSARWKQGQDNYEDAALDWLLTSQLEPTLRRQVLSRISRPDNSNLAKIVADDLNTKDSGGFGSLNIHRQLTLAQLDELLKLKPDLLNATNFVHAWTVRLHPGDDEDWQHNPALTKAYLDRLVTFTRKLSPVFNPFKAHALYHRLVLDQSMGTLDKALFTEYLKLPRFQGYMSKAMLENAESRRQVADLNANYLPLTMLSIIGNDESLVRDYLKHFLINADSPKEFEPYINDIFLKHLFAETKIENGLGEPEEWASLLPPELFRQLKDRVDIDFALTNKTAFAIDEPVKLELLVKNVPNLMVKIFEINTRNFYRTQKREVDTAVNLDGLVANWEESASFTETPFRRMGRTMEFKQLNKPGVYVIDFIGGGKSSRALIRKGRLRSIAGMSTVGQKLTIIDESGKTVQGATVWLGGQEFKADEKGIVLVPFSTSPRRQPIVISSGDFSSLDFLDHQPEHFTLTAGIHVDRESLLTQRVAALLVRPSIRLNNLPVSVRLLEDCKLVITAIDQDGIGSSTEVPNFKLFEDRESVHEFRVPSRLARLNISLQGKVKCLSTGKETALAAGNSIGVDGISKTDKIEDLHLAKFGDDYVVELLGRSGEPKADRPVALTIKHREFRETVNVVLKSDAQGRVKLGSLADITQVTAMNPEGTSHSWSLPIDRHSYRKVMHAVAGELVAVPYLGSAEKPARAELALFEMRGANIQTDRFNALAIKDGMIEINGLKAGDYDLFLKTTGERVRLRIVDGAPQSGYVLGQLRHLQLPALKPVQIAGIASDDEAVTIQLRDFSIFTRLHIYGTRYLPAFSAFTDLAKVRDAELQGMFPASAESIFLAGRNIGDEYRYVLDRRNQKKFPGNMLARPTLLLNPWVVRSTETGEQLAKDGEEYKRMVKDSPAQAISTPGPHAPALPSTPKSDPGLDGGDFANLDFLYDASATLLNLVPDKNGVVKIPRKALGVHAMIHVLAVDPVNTTARSISLPERKTEFVDLRLRRGLDPRSPFSQQKQVTVLAPKQMFVLDDAASSRFEAYDSLAKVYGLYATLTHDPKLAEFSFILTWPTLKQNEKLALYSKFACHELNFFLSRKDPEFFKAIVKPYLANKKDKTFLDRWLIEENLKDYLQPWQHSQLNTVERILLAERIAGEPAKTARYLNDLARLMPSKSEHDDILFEAALKAGDLNLGGDKSGDKLLMLTDDTSSLAVLGIRTTKVIRPMGGFPASGQSGVGKVIGKHGDEAPDAPFKDIKVTVKERVTGSFMIGGGVTSDAGLRGSNSFDKRNGTSFGFPMPNESWTVDGSVRTASPSGDHYWLDDDRRESSNKAPARLYRRLDLTEELAENNYYKLTSHQQRANRIDVSGFWVDYAQNQGKRPFLSRNLAEASHNFTEMMFALAVLDLPFVPAKQEVKFEGGRMTFVSDSTVLLFHETIKPTARAGDIVQIFISQNFFRHGDRFRDENGERFDKFITDEFVVQTVYGCQIVVTNATPSRQRLSLLYQVPVGAIPVANGQPTKSAPLDLEPYRTQVIEFAFYFPKPGKFAHFPVNVSKSEVPIATAAPITFNVVEKPSRPDSESWDYVSQSGSAQQVVAMLNRENINTLDLEKIAFRMKDRDFFETALTLLRDRHAWNATLWSYGVLHNDARTIKEYFAHMDLIVNECGGPIASQLLVVDPVTRGFYEHLEYSPLVNARKHSLGQARQIVNARFHEHYLHYVNLLSYRPTLNDDEQLAVTYYLLLQDRIEDALASFAQVHPEQIATRMQYDYCAAYLDMFNDEPKKVRSIIAKYLNHPVERWRNAFAQIANQLDEFDGKAVKIAEKEDQAQQQAKLAAKEPSFEFGVAAKTINLTWKNVETVRINYYLMDVELLFSRNPFVQQSGGQFANIRANQTQEIKLPNFQTKLAIPMPENFADKNVLVEITANGKTRSVPVLANAMAVTLNENYGHLQVTDAANGKSLSKVYVKTYVRLANGTVKFHKDGYTDHRGKFDYASVSTSEQVGIVRFGILVLSETQGALIREVAPPQQ